jgi:tetratricopeptide (TPR) repeat protein
MLSTSENDAQQSLSMAIKKLNAGAYDESINICKNLIATKPEIQVAAVAHLAIGHAYLLLRQFEASEQELKAGLQLDASQAQGYVDLGLIYIRRRFRPEAISYLRKAQECSVTNPELRLTLAVAWLQVAQYQEAYLEIKSLLQSHEHNLPRGGLHVVKGIAWYGKIVVPYRLLLVIPLAVTLMMPFVGVGVWILVTMLTLGALLVLRHPQLRLAGVPALIYGYLLCTGMFLLSLVLFGMVYKTF